MQLVHAFTTSKLDIRKALLHGLPDTQIKRLQKLQNHAAHLVTGTSGREHITPVLKALHWLPIWERIAYKRLPQVYRALYNQGPSYTAHCSSCTLLPDPFVLHRTFNWWSLGLVLRFGDKTFSRVARILWNSIPISVQRSTSLSIFKKRIKTGIFRRAFST